MGREEPEGEDAMAVTRHASSDNVELAYDDVLATSGKAVLFLVDGEEIWIPTSQFGDASEADSLERGCGDGSVEVTEWIAKKKELI
jgi:hypothetical protein